MKTPSIILYVESPAAAARFYGGLLGKEPTESSPGFAMFVLEGGNVLGLWAGHDVKPGATTPGGAELCFTVESRDAVQAAHDEWKGRGLRIIQAPVAMDFGFTFTALDPDGHRLRVFVPAES
jgi:predicted enzyme related to lactoylglutathione lyase